MGRELDESNQRRVQISNYKIKVDTRDVVYNLTNRYNTTISYIAVKRANPQNSHPEKREIIFFYFYTQ